jgi:hypothetical protein
MDPTISHRSQSRAMLPGTELNSCSHGCQKISSSLRRERGIFFLTSPLIEHSNRTSAPQTPCLSHKRRDSHGVLGIWSMHYIGTLAFRLPVPVLYAGLHC